MPPHVIHHINTDHPVEWLWPLEVGMLQIEDADTISRQLNSSDIAQMFSVIRENVTNSRVNILYNNSGWEDAKRAIVYASRTHEADVIVIREVEEFFERALDLGHEIQEFIAQSRTAGIFFIHFELSLSNWFEQLILELSHDVDFCDAIKNTSNMGLFYYQKNLCSQARISSFVDVLIIGLDKYELQSSIRISSRLLGGEVDMTPSQIAGELYNTSFHLKYDPASNDAEHIAELSSEICSTLSQGFLDIGRSMQKGIGNNSDHVEGSVDGPSRSKMELQEDKALVPRFLQAKLSHGMEQASLEKIEYLSPSEVFFMLVRIGPYERDWAAGTTPFKDQVVFEESRDDQELVVFFRNDTSGEVVAGKLTLPYQGASSVVTYKIPPIGRNQLFKGSIYCYHRNRLVQHATINVWSVLASDQDNYPPLSVEIQSSPRAHLDDLSNRREFGSSFLLDVNGKQNEIITNNGTSMVSLRYEHGLRSIIAGIRKTIEDTVINISEHPEDLLHINNAKVLVRLALKGRKLYDLYLEPMDINDTGPIQIVSSTKEYIPLEFAYTFPAPKVGATICPGASRALELGCCQDCPMNGESEVAYVCPLGFWIFSRVIERHAFNGRNNQVEKGFDFSLVFNEPVGRRRTLTILERVLFAASHKVENASPGLIEKVFKKIAQHVNDASQVQSWEKWIEQINAKSPDSLLLLVHTEHNMEVDEDQIEIGEGDFKLQPFLNEKYMMNTSSAKLPILILIGCNTHDTNAGGFDLTYQFTSHGVPIVLSNFTKIRGRQAGPILIQLLEVIKSQVGDSSFGTMLLRLRQKLMAKGVLVGLALVAHGDADWKIKVK